jgi:hypothetical protein
MWILRAVVCIVPLLSPAPAAAGPLVIDARLHHLRAGTQPEWSDFPAKAEGASLTVKFRAQPNATEQTLRLRQQDVKQTWRVSLNGKPLGSRPISAGFGIPGTGRIPLLMGPWMPPSNSRTT